MPKKIRDVIENNQGKILKIGFASGFVYCDYATFLTMNDLDIAGKDFLENQERILKTTQLKYDSLKDLGRSEYVRIQMHKQEEDERFLRPLRSEKSFAREYKEELDSMECTIKVASASLREFKPFAECEATKVYRSRNFDNTLIIVSKDNRRVRGNYWTVEEYRKGKQC